MNQDVVCCLTPSGSSAIAVIGLRGPTVWNKLSPYFRAAKKQPVLSPHAQSYLGQLERDGLGDEIVLVLQGHAGEQEIELQLHGGPGIQAWCMQLAKESGCTVIDWPDWIHGALWKLLPLATTKKTAGILLDQCQGAFDHALTSLQEQWNQKSIDRQQLDEQVQQLISWHALGAHLVTPWKIVLVGPPNVGKSSLFNALLGFERAITSPEPGTTRDLVTATIAWDGYPMEFIDTAGLRTTEEQLETAGMEKTRQASEKADLVLWLVDLSHVAFPRPADMNAGMFIGTKADLPRLNTSDTMDVEVSAVTGTGLKKLLQAIKLRLLPVEPVPGQAIPVLPTQMEELLRLRQLFSAT